MPLGAFERRESVAPMTTIRVFYKFRLAEVRRPFDEELSNLWRAVDENARRLSELEAGDVAERSDACQQAEHVVAEAFAVVRTVFANSWWRCHLVANRQRREAW